MARSTDKRWPCAQVHQFFWTGSGFLGQALKDPFIYYFAMLGKHFGMRQVRIWLTFTLVKPPDLMGGVCASPCNLIVRDQLTY
jgi:hypothetical protein